MSTLSRAVVDRQTSYMMSVLGEGAPYQPGVTPEVLSGVSTTGKVGSGLNSFFGGLKTR